MSMNTAHQNRWFRPAPRLLEADRAVGKSYWKTAGVFSAVVALATLAPSASMAQHLRRLPPVSPVLDDASHTGDVRLASHIEPVEFDSAPATQTVRASSIVPPSIVSEEFLSRRADHVQTIDLANALALGGASSLQVELARERVIESQSKLLEARAFWLPSLRFGLGYTRHDGQIQETQGPVIQSGRNSLFVGGGAGLGNAPLLGGAGGPPRLFVNLSLSDAFFAPLAAARMLDASDAAESATLNDELLAVAEAYFELVGAHGRRANAATALQAADQMVRLTTLFEREGAGSQAEVDRATAERTHWQLAVEDADRSANARSAELARLLSLDAGIVLVPAEDQVAPVTVVSLQMPREALIAQGLTARPEMAEHQWLVAAALEQMRQEYWRPWLPNVQVGASGGSFGGGPANTFANQRGRGDVELLAIWELQNMGLGNRALRQQQSSHVRAAETEAELMRDQIIAQIVTAAGDVESFRRQTDLAQQGIIAAEASYRRNESRVREAEGLPLELLQSIRARAAAHDDYTHAATSYSRAQYQLLRALGQPPDVP